MEEVYETLRVYYHYKGPTRHLEEAVPSAEKPPEKPHDPWKPNTPLGARILKTVELHAQKPAIHYLRESPAKGLELVTLKWDDVGIATIRYAKCLYSVLRSLTARHSHAGRAIFVIPIVTATASADAICLYLATLLIGAAPVFVWGACGNRAATALRTLAPAAVFIEGDALHNDLKQANGLPSSISRLILFGVSAPSSPSPAVSPVPSAVPSSPPASPVPGSTQVLTWKSFLDGGDQLREPSNLSLIALDDDAPSVVILSGKYTRASILSARALLHAAQNVATMLEVAEQDSTLTAAPLAHASQLLFSVFVPQITGCATYLIPDWKTFLSRPSQSVPSIYSLPAKLWERLIKWMQAHLGSTAPEPAKQLQWQISIREISGLSGARLAASFASTLPQTASLYISNHIGIPLADVYGTSETAGALSVRFPYTAQPMQVFSGVELVLVGKEMNVKGASVCLSFLFPDPTPRNDGWLPIGDAAEDTGGGKYKFLGPVRSVANSDMDAALAGIREHVIVEDAIVAENGSAIVVLRTAPFLRSLVQQHTNTVFARYKQTPPEIMLCPVPVTPALLLPSLAVDPVPVLASIATDLAARAGAQKKDKEELQDTPAAIRSRRLFNVHKMTATRAATSSKSTHKKDKERSKDRDREKESLKPPKRDSARRDKEHASSSGSKTKDRDGKEREHRDHKERSTTKDSARDSSSATPKEGLKESRRDMTGKDSSLEKASSSDKAVPPLTSSSAAIASPASSGPADKLINSADKLATSAPAGAARIATTQPLPAAVRSSTATAVVTSPPRIVRRDTMTIMALEMKEQQVVAPPVINSAASKKSKGNVFTEGDMQQWLEEVLGAKVFQDGVTSSETLRDGIVLCRLMQALRPGSIKKYNAMKGAFFQLENIQQFLSACTQHMGLAKTDLFDVRDLYDQANFVKVLHTIDMVHRAARNTGPALNASSAGVLT